MTREEKFRMLWLFLSQNGFCEANMLNVVGMRVELTHSYDYMEHRVNRLYVNDNDKENIRYETDSFHCQHISTDNERGLDSAASIYDRLQELGYNIAKLDKNLF